MGKWCSGVEACVVPSGSCGIHLNITTFLVTTLKENDHTLGMGRDISRRDFINGVAVAVGTLALPMSVLAAESEQYASGANP
jgi:hypothetical protein